MTASCEAILFPFTHTQIIKGIPYRKASPKKAYHKKSIPSV